MELLEYLQNNTPINENFIPRKCILPNTEYINLYGARGVGKSALVLDHIKQFDKKSVLYIDMDDPNLFFDPLRELQQYINQNGIKLLIMDHFYNNDIKLPKVDGLIIISREPCNIVDFNSIELMPLDYEEFLAFENHIIQTNAFTHFLKSGALPVMAKAYKSHQSIIKQFMQSRFDMQELKLLYILAEHHTEHLSINQIYSFAKEKFKISKDWLYSAIKSFQDEGLIHFIDDISKKGGKKLIIYDTAVAKYLTFKHSFMMQFDSTIAMTLIKQNKNFETLGIHGYVTDDSILIIPAPFDSEEGIWAKSQKKFSIYKRHGIKHVIIITVANQYGFSIENINFEALPFYEWSITDEI
ncbi:MAG: AAA family ATPase [Sulfurovaceae bacterium]